MKITIVNGAQWGDEGKGKLTHSLATQHDICVRCNGGSNAEHTFFHAGEIFKFRLLPIGLMQGNTAIISDNVVIGCDWLASDIKQAEKILGNLEGKLLISSNAHIVLPVHRERDAKLDDNKLKIGTIRQGVGPAIADRVSRVGINVATYLENYRELADEFGCWEETENYVELLKRHVCDTKKYLFENSSDNKRIMLEGAQGFMLDNIYGTYPFVTSSFTTTAGLLHGAGLPHHMLKRNIGVVKAYVTRFSTGPFVTQAAPAFEQLLRDTGGEYSTYIKKPMRCGWFDMVAMRYAHQINHYTEIAMNKLDVLSVLDEIPICIGYRHKGKIFDIMYDWSNQEIENYEPIYKTFKGWRQNIRGINDFNDLPLAAKDYVHFIEDELNVPIVSVGTGPEQNDMIFKE